VKELQKQFNLNLIEIDLSRTYHQFVSAINLKNQAALNNLKVRMRMSCLYAIAQQEHCLVLGTTNADEYYLGYFTKFGDIACDLASIISLNKMEVYQAAEILNIPRIITKRKPTASLYLNQSDEEEIGLPYEKIDDYLYKNKGSEKTGKLIKEYHSKNSHKFKQIITPIKFK